MYSELKQRIVSSDESFLFKGEMGIGKTRFLFDCFLEKVNVGANDNIFFLNSSFTQTYFLREQAVLDNRFSSGYNQLNIFTFNDFIKFFIKENLLFSDNIPFSLPADQYPSSKTLFLYEILSRITLPEPYETWKTKEKFAGNVGEIFAFLSDLSINPDFLRKIKGYEWFFDAYNLYKTESLKKGFYFSDIFPVLSERVFSVLTADSFVGNYYFYIDDLQEIIPSQYTFLKSMISFFYKKNITCRFFVCHDVDYCLNTSRGASLSLIDKVMDDFYIPRGNIIELKSDNRQNKFIYRLRSSLIKYSDELAENDLTYEPETDNSIKCVQSPTRLDELYYISAEINNFIKNGVLPSEIGVFVSKFDKNSVLLKTLLNSRGISVEFEFGDFIEKSIIYRFFKSFLNVVENLDSDELVSVFLDSPVFSISNLELGEIRERASYCKMSIFDSAVRYCDIISDLKKREIIRKTLFFLYSLNLEDTGILDIFYKFCGVSGLLNYAQHHEYTELNILRKILKAADYFVSFYTKLNNGKNPSLKNFIDNEKYFMPSKMRNTNLEQLDSVKIVSLSFTTPSKFKVVFVPNMNFQVFSNLNRERVPVLLNDIVRKIPYPRELPYFSDRNHLLNAVDSAGSKIFFLYAKDSGEPSPLYDYIKSLPYARFEYIEQSFAEFDAPFFIQDTAEARVWADRKLARNSSENNEFIKKTISLFIPAVDFREDSAIPELALPVSLSEDHTFSATDLDFYLECPRKFFLLRLIKIEDESLIEKAALGQLIHSVLELYHSVYPDWRGCLSSNEIKKRKNFLFNLLDGRQVTYLEGFNDFVKRIISFQAKNCLLNYWEALLEDKMKIYYLEKTINFFIDNIPFISKIDRIDDGSEKGGYRIIDYKTGGSGGKAAALKNEFVFEESRASKKSFQLPVYYFAAKEVMGINVCELSKFFLQAKDKSNQSYCLKSVLPIEPESKSKQITEEELRDVKMKIISYVNQIKNGVYEKSKSKCYECPCSFICR